MNTYHSNIPAKLNKPLVVQKPKNHNLNLLKLLVSPPSLSPLNPNSLSLSYHKTPNVQTSLGASQKPYPQPTTVPRVLSSFAHSPDPLDLWHVIRHLLSYFPLLPFYSETAWFCLPLLFFAVSVTLKYGYYGNRHFVLGPSSSRLLEASSVFVKQIQVRDEYEKGVSLYGFSEKPELSLERNWSVSTYVIVASYGRKGFALWLNKGSTLRIRWEAQTSCLGQLEVSIIKGERNLETLIPTSTSPPDAHALSEPVHGREAEYAIEEDDKYCLRIVNTNPRSIIMVVNVNVSSKIYDTTTAESMCSTTNGSCRLDLLFPNTQFVAVTTPNNGELGEWYIELSFVARVVTYIAILGFVIIIIFLILKYLGACDGDHTREEETQARQVTEADPLIPEKPFRLPYGTGDEDDLESGSSSSSEDLYDGKICVICYEEPRNCFFVPCGHCATCYTCAQRIMDGETKVCPICRRLIHKVRKLLIP